MISIEELKQRFPDVREFSLYGSCVVVPGTDFDPDWECELEDQGYKVHMAELDGKAVTLVSCAKKQPVEEGEKQVFAPPPPEPESRRHLMLMTPTANTAPPIRGRGSYLAAGNKLVPWHQQELDRLLEEWPRARGSVEEKAEALTKLFPGRTAVAIKLRYLKLLNLGRVKPSKASQKEVAQKSGLRRAPKGFYWSEEETQKLVNLWNQDTLLGDILAAFPNRSEKSLTSTISRLQKTGKIPKRKKGSRPGRPRRKAVDACPDCGLAKDLCCCDEEKKEQRRSHEVAAKQPQNSDKVETVSAREVERLTDVVDALVVVVDKLGCQAIMQSLEFKQSQQTDFKIPLGLWTAYASALTSSDEEDRYRFRLKVHKLLEAYA